MRKGMWFACGVLPGKLVCLLVYMDPEDTNKSKVRRRISYLQVRGTEDLPQSSVSTTATLRKF